MFGDTCSDRGVWTPNPQRATPSNSCEPGDRPGHHAAAHIGGSRLEKPGDQEDCEHRPSDDDSNNDHRQILAQRFRHVLTLVVGHESTECSGLGCAPGAKAPDIENLGGEGSGCGPMTRSTSYSVVMARGEMREPTYLVLLALADEPRHGYGIISTVKDLSDGRTTLGAGTLYGALDRLVSEGRIEPDHDEHVDGRLRRYYRLTGNGRQAILDETLRRQAIAEKASVRLAGIQGLAGAQ